MPPAADLATILQTLNPVLNPGVYAYVSINEPAELNGAEVFATVREPEGLSAVVRESDALTHGLPIMFKASWITLSVQSDLHAVGLTAAVANALAEARISCNVVAGAWHDHLFVPVLRAQEALALLRRLQDIGSEEKDAKEPDS